MLFVNVLQVHVLQVHVLQPMFYKSMFYKSSPVHSLQVQSSRGSSPCFLHVHAVFYAIKISVKCAIVSDKLGCAQTFSWGQMENVNRIGIPFASDVDM